MIEKRIGEKIRELRKLHGLSQMELAERLGLSFQQIQKYEKGMTRISVSRLSDISEVFGVDITEFFKGYKESYKIKESSSPYGESLIYTKDKSELRILRYFRKIKNPALKDGIIRLVRIISNMERDL